MRKGEDRTLLWGKGLVGTAARAEVQVQVEQGTETKPSMPPSFTPEQLEGTEHNTSGVAVCFALSHCVQEISKMQEKCHDLLERNSGRTKIPENK